MDLTIPTNSELDATKSKYELEKALGLRFSSGMQIRKKVKAIHWKMYKLHLAGYSHQTIADALEVAYSTVQAALSQPWAQEGGKKHIDELRSQFDMLREKANNAVRKGLDNEDPDVNLRAANLFFKQQGDFTPKGQAAGETAEDVIKRMLQLNVQVNIGGGE